MRRLRRWRRLALVIAAALLGTTLSSVALPSHVFANTVAIVSEGGHGNHNDCCAQAGDGDCAAECAAVASCVLGHARPAHVVTSLELPDAVPVTTQSPHILRGITPSLESPPPRA
jgi:hypothetical protein